jgi:putative AbiEii toxin of type IV toxin-antitoxin system
LYDKVVALKEDRRTLASRGRELTSAQEQAASLEKGLPTLSDDLATALKEHPLRLTERQVVGRFTSETTAIADVLAETLVAIADMPHAISLDESSPQNHKIHQIHEKLGQLFSKARRIIQDLQAEVRSDSDAISAEIAEWVHGHETHEELYRRAEGEAREHRQKLDQIKKLREQEASAKRDIEALAERVSALSEREGEFRQAWMDWVALHKVRGDDLEAACAALSSKSDGEIEADLRRGADIEDAVGRLREAFRGCNIREANWEALSDHLLTDNPAEAWVTLMEELRPLAELHDDDASSDDAVPRVSGWELTPAMRRKMAGKLSPPRRWLDIALTPLRDKPRFYYRPRSGDRMEFSNASAGQQATALLKVMLSESSGPLVIDQPEEDLDNVIIREITEVMWSTKCRRQLLFASHNANIVVNGDADLVIHCDYRKEGGSTKGQIAGLGAIDKPSICNAIKRVMEGGEQAFELRRRKYGF